MKVLEGLQGNVLSGYGTDHALYLFTRVRDAEAARRWLDAERLGITTYRGWEEQRSETTLNAAFTYRGLIKLGVPALRIEHLSVFREGMRKRHILLGDIGDSDARNWDKGLRKNHVLLVLTARDGDALAVAGVKLRQRIAAGSGLAILAEQEAHRLPDGAEHFGVSDGFSQPAVASVAGGGPRIGEGTLTRWRHWRRLALGEFVLGNRDEGGLFPPAPLGPLGDDATFMVVRKLAQHVAEFRSYIADTAGRLDRSPEWVRAKMIGRWDNGSALARYPDAPGPSASRDPNASRFRYGTDPKGLRCPRGAHVRRANPRDSGRWQGRMTQRHRIIRRGMPYGPPLAEVDGGQDRAPRGLMFVCYQADIKRQFEFIQRQWLSDGDALQLGSDPDPLVAPQGTRRGMVIPGQPGCPPVFLRGIPPFVTTRGGGYYLLPGTAGLRALAAGAC